MEVPVEYLRECFDYDPETGVLTWKPRPRGHFRTEVGWRTYHGRFPGKEAGCPGSFGGWDYLIVCVCFGGKTHHFLAHRVIWVLLTGKWPPYNLQIDHIDGNGLNNRPNNLRLATQAENRQNHRTQKNNTSGYNGVCRKRDKWRARIKIDGRELSLGAFDRKEDAYSAYLAAKLRHHTFNPVPREN